MKLPRPTSETPPPRAPAGRRVYAVGDIHGRADLLERLHARISDDATAAAADGVQAVVVYLGDYVDRGAQSRDVIDILSGDPLPGFERIFLKGNHEDMMLRFLAGPADPLWLFNGGTQTLASYDAMGSSLETGHWDLEGMRRRLAAALPASHLEFLRSLRLAHEEGDYLFVHAGVRPGRPLAEQNGEDLMWIRGPFLGASAPFGRFVVHGHTITSQPEVRTNRIGIDTGAFFSDVLTCLVLEGDRRRFLQTLS
jgi:serine/threonine protein phosphatase 1